MINQGYCWIAQWSHSGQIINKTSLFNHSFVSDTGWKANGVSVSKWGKNVEGHIKGCVYRNIVGARKGFQHTLKTFRKKRLMPETPSQLKPIFGLVKWQILCKYVLSLFAELHLYPKMCQIIYLEGLESFISNWSSNSFVFFNLSFYFALGIFNRKVFSRCFLNTN